MSILLLDGNKYKLTSFTALQEGKGLVDCLRVSSLRSCLPRGRPSAF